MASASVIAGFSGDHGQTTGHSARTGREKVAARQEFAFRLSKAWLHDTYPLLLSYLLSVTTP